MLRIVLLLIPLLVALPLPGPTGSQAQAQSMGEEAERQLAFARSELAEGKYERAMASAESALRLNPALYEALLVKALALAGLDNRSKAEALLVTYIELAGKMASPEAAEALELLRNPRKRRGKRASSNKTDSGSLRVEAEKIDPGELWEEIQEALKAGDCAAAIEKSNRWTKARAGDVGGWLATGHAYRCASDYRTAVRAYRRYRRAGGPKESIPRLIKALEESLAILRVEVDLGNRDHVPALALTVDGEGIGADFWSDNRAEFRDLTPGVEIVLGIAGRGIKLESRELEPLGPGEARMLRLKPGWIGLGKVEVTDYDGDACRVRVAGRDGEQELAPGGKAELTAGLVSLMVENEHGIVETQYELAEGEKIRFDPMAGLPAELTLSDLPAGSQLTLFVEAPGGRVLEKEVEVPQGGRLDRETGVILAEPLNITGLLPGTGGLWVKHPTLGELATTVVLGPGVNGASVDWRTMPNLIDLTSRYGIWQKEERLRRQKVAAAPVPTVILAIASGVASGTLLASGLIARQDYEDKAAVYQADMALGRPHDGDAWSEMDDAWNLSQSLLAGAGGAGGGVALGIGFSIAIGAGVRARTPERPWTPQGF